MRKILTESEIKKMICCIVAQGSSPDGPVQEVFASEGLYRAGDADSPDIEWGFLSTGVSNANPLSRNSFVNFGNFIREKVAGFEKWRDVHGGSGHDLIAINMPGNEVQVNTKVLEKNQEFAFGSGTSLASRRPVNASWESPGSLTALDTFLHIELDNLLTGAFFEITVTRNDSLPLSSGVPPNRVFHPGFYMVKIMLCIGSEDASPTDYFIKAKTIYSSESGGPTGPDNDYALIPFDFIPYHSTNGRPTISIENKVMDWRKSTVIIDAYANVAGTYPVVAQIEAADINPFF